MSDIAHDRAAQMLMSAEAGLDFDAARRRLDGAALIVSCDGSIAEPWAQAALVALGRCGARMFRGGVYLQDGPDAPVRLAGAPFGSVRAMLSSAGFQSGVHPAEAFRLHLGHDPVPGAKAAAWADGWFGCCGPSTSAAVGDAPGNEISGVLCAAMALSEAFRASVLMDPSAGRRRQILSAWGPDAPVSGEIMRLPRALWLLGLGNLGQATAFILSLLPYGDHRPVLTLQDHDRTGAENLGVQILSAPAWIGERKGRSMAAWLEARGFETALVETRFTARTAPWPDGPRILLAGVDNLETRRCAAVAGLDLVIDAGLGATAADAFDLRLHAFPGRRSPETAWPPTPPPAAPPKLSSGLQQAVLEGRIGACGALTLAGKSVGVPCTALAAAALQIGQLCRALWTGRCCDLIDASLVDTRYADAHVMVNALAALSGAPALDQVIARTRPK